MEDLTALRGEISNLYTLVKDIKSIHTDMSRRIGVIEGWIPQVEDTLLEIKAHLYRESDFVVESPSGMPLHNNSQASADTRNFLLRIITGLLGGSILVYGAYLIAG